MRPLIPCLAVVVAGCTTLPERTAPAAEGSAPPAIEAATPEQRVASVDRSILFFGSSSIRQWRGLERTFPDADIVRQASNQVKLSNATRFVDRPIAEHRPGRIFIYAGENDLVAGESPETVLSAFERFVKHVRRRLPDAQVAFISIKPSPKFWYLADRYRAANELVRQFAAQHDQVDYVDVFDAMLDANGLPRDELFRDGVHPNGAGYAIWAQALEPYVRAGQAAPLR